MARWTRRQWIGLGARLLLLPLGFFMLLRWFERAQVFQPTQTLEFDGSVLGTTWESVEFAASDGVTLHAWFFRAAPSSRCRERVVLFCHGNGGNLSHRLDTYGLLVELGLDVLAFDYRGYGRSAGRPSEAGTYLDVAAAYAWLTSRGYAPGQILGYGESLGGGVAAELALRKPLGGLVLQSTFTSIPDIGAELFPWLPVRTISHIRYATAEKLPRVHVPVLILHSREDTMIGFHHAERNFAVANPPKWMAELAGDHNDPVSLSRDAFVAAMTKLLEEGTREPKPN